MTGTIPLDALKSAAFAAMERAYAPYSNFKVGAALRTDSGEIIVGCNVENSAYPAGTCAERCALGAAVVSGHQHFTHVVVATEAATPTPPCGICRQALSEFAPGCVVISVTRNGQEASWTLAELLPSPFTPSQLQSE